MGSPSLVTFINEVDQKTLSPTRDFNGHLPLFAFCSDIIEIYHEDGWLSSNINTTKLKGLLLQSFLPHYWTKDS